MKRTERHHLKEDEMAHGVHWLVELVGKYKREMTIVAGAVALAAAVFGSLLLVRSHARTVRSRAVGEVQALAAAAAADPAKLADLELLAAKRRTARAAELELAAHWAEKSDWAKAEAHLARIPAAPKDLLYYQAEHLEGQVALARKDFERAVAIYRKMVEEKPAAYPPDAALFHLAEALELKGETAEALELYKKLQADHAQSYFGYEASAKAARLEARK